MPSRRCTIQRCPIVIGRRIYWDSGGQQERQYFHVAQKGGRMQRCQTHVVPCVHIGVCSEQALYQCEIGVPHCMVKRGKAARIRGVQVDSG